MSDLDLRTSATLAKGGKHGPVVIAGKPDDSLLFRHLKGQAAPQMPLGSRLTDYAQLCADLFTQLPQDGAALQVADEVDARCLFRVLSWFTCRNGRYGNLFYRWTFLAVT